MPDTSLYSFVFQVTEVSLDVIHARWAKRVAKVSEFGLRIGNCAIQDGSVPSASIKDEVWQRLRRVLTFQPQPLELPRQIAESDELPLCCGYYKWLRAHSALSYRQFSEVPSAATILRDEAMYCWLIADFTTYSSLLAPAPLTSAKVRVICVSTEFCT